MGGTIASTPAEDGAKPTLSADDLATAVPEVDSFGTVKIDEVVRKPSAEIGFVDLDTLEERIRSVANDVEAVVVLHGTDTIEETAFYLDLTLDVSIPVVLSGAQRRFDETSPDGPANITDALRLAVSDPLLLTGGVYVAFDERLHAAADVTKAHTRRLDTFESPMHGPVASVRRNGLRFHRPAKPPAGIFPETTASARVETVLSGIDVDDGQIRRALEANVDGLVVVGTGLGNVTEPLATGIEVAIERDVVTVVVSRCHAGEVAPVYGSAGGGQRLANLGAILGGSLPPQKARIALSLACSATTDIEERWRLARRACETSDGIKHTNDIAN